MYYKLLAQEWRVGDQIDQIDLLHLCSAFGFFLALAIWYDQRLFSLAVWDGREMLLSLQNSDSSCPAVIARAACQVDPDTARMLEYYFLLLLLGPVWSDNNIWCFHLSKLHTTTLSFFGKDNLLIHTQKDRLTHRQTDSQTHSYVCLFLASPWNILTTNRRKFINIRCHLLTSTDINWHIMSSDVMQWQVMTSSAINDITHITGWNLVCSIRSKFECLHQI